MPPLAPAVGASSLPATPQPSASPAPSSSSSSSSSPPIGGEDIGAVVVDIGSHTIRVGNGQEDCPRQFFLAAALRRTGKPRSRLPPPGTVCGDCAACCCCCRAAAEVDPAGAGDGETPKGGAAGDAQAQEPSAKDGGASGRGETCCACCLSCGERAGRLVFPVSFYDKVADCEVRRCLSASAAAESVPPRDASLRLDEDVFRVLLYRTVQGTYPPASAKKVSASAGCCCCAASAAPAAGTVVATGVASRSFPEPFTTVASGGLGVLLEEHAVLVTEPTQTDFAFREKTAKILFEEMAVPAAFWAKQAMLAAFAVGKSTALVVDVGASGLSVSPVYEGFCLQRNTRKYPVAGDFLDEIVARVLARETAATRRRPPAAPTDSTAHFGGLCLPAFTRRRTRAGAEAQAAAEREEAELFRGVCASFLRESSQEVARTLKESVCRVQTDSDDEEEEEDEGEEEDEDGGNEGRRRNKGFKKKVAKAPGRPPSRKPGKKSGSASSGEEDTTFVSDEEKKKAALASKKKKRRCAASIYELPDGSLVNCDQNLKFDVGEVLFRPKEALRALGLWSEVKEATANAEGNEQTTDSYWEKRLDGFKGVTKAIEACIDSCDVDIRRELLASIVITGGTSLMPGFLDRVSKELHSPLTFSFSNSPAIKVRVVAPNTSVERAFSTWLGGSILASLGTFQQLWISKREYEEHGVDVINRRCA
ncbi:actin-related protein ARP4A [Besnoitia besnoiti]|uniref:Actin-related protein ARP4A n=1 Tax=Besnoitia besnoiti TaxID=94643 RepID=A0A2A9M6B7_BESBE|nr:actin-related protein ARP4A [Besnoitia besnoiti]PFH31187.1 actin-related protein ARP4A [Besnoitia besnoiti]